MTKNVRVSVKEMKLAAHVDRILEDVMRDVHAKVKTVEEFLQGGNKWMNPLPDKFAPFQTFFPTILKFWQSLCTPNSQEQVTFGLFCQKFQKLLKKMI